MFLSLLLLLMSTASATEPAKFTVLEYKTPAPFAGVLFDENAISKIMADYDIYKYSCDIKMEYQLDLQKEEYEYKLENMRIEHKALTDEYDLFIMQKNTEIDALTNALKKTSPRYKWLYFAGGILIGTASTYAVYKTLR
mgnify:CR=1 FL=1